MCAPERGTPRYSKKERQAEREKERERERERDREITPYMTQDGGLMPVGTMALMEKVEWSQLTPEEGGPPEVEGKPWTPWGGSDVDSKALVR
jgi:hypothetical protein